MSKQIFMTVDLAIWVTLGAMLLYLFFRSRRAKASQNDLVKGLESGTYLNWFRVKLATPAYYRKRMKVVGFESSALLVNMQDRVRVIAELRDGEKLDRSYPKDELQLEWIGNPGLGSSNMHWISLGKNQQQIMLSADTGFNAVQSREATADICRMIAPGFRLPELARSDFALEKNRASLTLVIAFFALLLFAMLDGVVLNKNELVEFGSFALLLPGMVVFAIPAYLVLVRNRVPSRESLALSMLLVCGMLVALIPALKRVDQLLAAGPQTYQYKLVEGGRLEPLTQGPPPLFFRRTQEYWAQFEPGSIHDFVMTRGPLGLWQVDRGDLNADFRKFYAAYDANK